MCHEFFPRFSFDEGKQTGKSGGKIPQPGLNRQAGNRDHLKNMIMNHKTSRALPTFATLMLASAALILAGCQSPKLETSQTATPAVAAPAAAAATVAAAPVAPPTVTTPAAPAAVPPPVHIKAGLANSLTDADGVVWIADQGFADGDTIDRGEDVQIANTKSPALYRSEHYGMTAFSYPVPNGKYIVKLHFAETYDAITAAGERVFSFNVQGKEFKDFDVFVKAGGALRAYIETVPVEVTDGKLAITFTSNIENPEINGIEILPAP